MKYWMCPISWWTVTKSSCVIVVHILILTKAWVSTKALTIRLRVFTSNLPWRSYRYPDRRRTPRLMHGKLRCEHQAFLSCSIPRKFSSSGPGRDLGKIHPLCRTSFSPCSPRKLAFVFTDGIDAFAHYLFYHPRSSVDSWRVRVGQDVFRYVAPRLGPHISYASLRRLSNYFCVRVTICLPRTCAGSRPYRCNFPG